MRVQAGEPRALAGAGKIVRTYVMNEPRSLRIGVWWVVTFSLLITLPALLWVIFPREIFDWYQGEFLAPAIEKKYGFEGGTFKVKWEGRTANVYGIKAVVPGGEFARAGVVAGDIPVGFHHSQRVEFLYTLSHPEAPELELQFVPIERVLESPRRVKSVRVRTPSGAS